MIVEGLKLMLAGMLVVYVFLSVLLLMIKVSAHFFGSSPQSVGKPAGTARTASHSAKKVESNKTAVILSAAIAAYKSRKG